MPHPMPAGALRMGCVTFPRGRPHGRMRRAEGGGAGGGDTRVLARLKQVGTVLLYGAMLLAILALWNNDAPQFIYVAF